MADETETLRAVPLHNACNRVTLLLGADRRLAIMSGAMGALVIVGSMGPAGLNLFLVVSAIFISVAMLWSARKLAKADPQMLDIYKRHMVYRKFYPAQSTPWKANTKYDIKRWE